MSGIMAMWLKESKVFEERELKEYFSIDTSSSEESSFHILKPPLNFDFSSSKVLMTQIAVKLISSRRTLDK